MHLKKFESFTRLAAEISDMDSKFNFTIPNDNIPLQYCKIKFPDGAIFPFSISHENYRDDKKTLIIKSINQDNNNIHYHYNRYLKLYGDCIQFESFKEYRFSRMYHNFIDLIDYEFDAYIYDNTGEYGFNEITISITKDVSPSIYSNCIIKNEQSFNLCMDQSYLIKITDPKYRSNIPIYFNKFKHIFEKYDRKILTNQYIGNIYTTELNLPHSLPNKKIGLLGLLYLCYINNIIPYSESLVNILNLKSFDVDDVILLFYDVKPL